MYIYIIYIMYVCVCVGVYLCVSFCVCICMTLNELLINYCLSRSLTISFIERSALFRYKWVCLDISDSV